MALVRSASGNVGNGDITVAKPAGTANGDYLVAFHFLTQFGDPAGMTPASGWSQSGSTGGSGSDTWIKIWVRTAGSSEPANYTFGNPNAAVIIIVCVTGQSNTDPVNVVPTFNSGGVTASHVAPSIAPTADNCLLLCGWGYNTATANQSYTPAASMIEQGDFFSGFEVGSVASQVLTGGSGVATGTRTAVATEGAGYTAVSLAIAPLGEVSGTGSADLGTLTALATGVRETLGTALATLGALNASALGIVTTPEIAATLPSGWYGLLTIKKEAEQWADYEQSRPPIACPMDGEPLSVGPNGQLYCKFDGWQPG